MTGSVKNSDSIIPSRKSTGIKQSEGQSPSHAFQRKVEEKTGEAQVNLKLGFHSEKRNFVSLFIRQCKKVKVSLAASLIRFMIWVDERIVSFKHKKGNDLVPTRYNYPNSKQTRRTALPQVIADNTEKLYGVTYPKGIAEDILKLYTNPRLVVVSDGDVNPFGHALMAFGDPDGSSDRYVQISSAHWYPEHLDSDAIQKYFKDRKCKVAYEISIDCKHPEAMREKINELSQKRWLWQGPVHNCLTFCKEISQAAAGCDIFDNQSATVSNRFANAATSVTQCAVREVCKNFPSTIKTIAPNLQKALDQIKAYARAIETPEASDFTNLPQYSNTPQYKPVLLTQDDYITQALEQIKDDIQQFALPKNMQKKLLAQLKAEIYKQVKNHLEQEARKVLENSHRDLADLPIATAYNIHPSQRKVGPQSLAGFLDDDGL